MKLKAIITKKGEQSDTGRVEVCYDIYVDGELLRQSYDR